MDAAITPHSQHSLAETTASPASVLHRPIPKSITDAHPVAAPTASAAPETQAHALVAPPVCVLEEKPPAPAPTSAVAQSHEPEASVGGPMRAGRSCQRCEHHPYTPEQRPRSHSPRLRSRSPHPRSRSPGPRHTAEAHVPILSADPDLLALGPDIDESGPQDRSTQSSLSDAMSLSLDLVPEATRCVCSSAAHGTGSSMPACQLQDSVHHERIEHGPSPRGLHQNGMAHGLSALASAAREDEQDVFDPADAAIAAAMISAVMGKPDDIGWVHPHPSRTRHTPPAAAM